MCGVSPVSGTGILSTLYNKTISQEEKLMDISLRALKQQLGFGELEQQEQIGYKLNDDD